LRSDVKDDVAIGGYKENKLLKKQSMLLRGKIARVTNEPKEPKDGNFLLPIEVKLRQNYCQSIVTFIHEFRNVGNKKQEHMVSMDKGFSRRILNGTDNLEKKVEESMSEKSNMPNDKMVFAFLIFLEPKERGI
jgi:hypothetical protein